MQIVSAIVDFNAQVKKKKILKSSYKSISRKKRELPSNALSQVIIKKAKNKIKNSYTFFNLKI